jgi:hypothetical protein
MPPRLFEGLANPGLLILSRLEPGGLQSIVSCGGPMSVREFAAQHRDRGLCSRSDAERQVCFGEASQGFLNMPRRWKLRHDDAKRLRAPV